MGGFVREVDGNALASMFGVSRTTVANWVRSGCPREPNGKFKIPHVIAWKAKRDAGRGGSPGEGGDAASRPNLDGERARLAREQADKLAMENAISRGELVHVDDAAAMIEEVVVAIKAKILSLGTKLAPLVVSCSSIVQVRALIDRSADELLRDIAAIDPGRNRGAEEGDQGAPPNVPSSSEADGLRVG